MPAVIQESMLVREYPDSVSQQFESSLSFNSSVTTYTEKSVGKMIVAAEAVDQAIPFGGVTNAKIVMLKVSSPVTAKVTGGATPNAIPVVRYMTLTGNDTNTITALSISTPAGLAVTVDYAIYG